MKKNDVLIQLCQIVTETANVLNQRTGKQFSSDCFCSQSILGNRADPTFCVSAEVIEFIVDTMDEALHPSKAPVGHPMNLQWED